MVRAPMTRQLCIPNIAASTTVMWPVCMFQERGGSRLRAVFGCAWIRSGALIVVPAMFHMKHRRQHESVYNRATCPRHGLGGDYINGTERHADAL